MKGLVDCEEIDDELELGGLTELQAHGTTESPSRRDVDEKGLVGEMFEMSGLEKRMPSLPFCSQA